MRVEGGVALPRPLLARGVPGARRPRRAAARCRRRRSTRRGSQALAPVLFAEGYDEQRAAALAAARQWTTVLTGGPGTGKTTAVAGLLALLADQSDRPLRIALDRPDRQGRGPAAGGGRARRWPGRAFAEPRATRSVEPIAQTLHRLLGWKRGSRNRFRHDRRNRLPHDVIVVDETSMVSLTMMARLVEAVRVRLPAGVRRRPRPARLGRGRGGARRPRRRPDPA